MRLLVVALVFLSAVAVLVGVTIRQSTIPVVIQSELLGAAGAYDDATVIVDGSRIASIEKHYPLTFEIAPEGSSETLRVVSQVSPPENFRLGNPVRVWGTYDRRRGVFEAYQVTTQCPSRYKATDEVRREKAREASASGAGRLAPAYERDAEDRREPPIP